MFLDGGNQLFGARYLATDCLFKFAAFSSGRPGQPNLQLNAKKQDRSQQRGRFRRPGAQPGQCAQRCLDAGESRLLIMFAQLLGANQSIAHQHSIVVGKLPERIV